MHIFINPSSKFFILLTTLFFSLYTIPAWAEYAGDVFEIQGVATKNNGIILKKGSRIDSSDTITTSKDSKVTLKMIDGGTVNVDVNSQMQIVTYRYDKKKKMDNGSEIKIVRGFFRITSGFLKEKQHVHTPLTNIGVQGTIYKVKVMEQAEFISVDEGTILLKEKLSLPNTVAEPPKDSLVEKDFILLKEKGKLPNAVAEPQKTRLGAESGKYFIRISQPNVHDALGISNAVWEEFETKPNDFPKEF